MSSYLVYVCQAVKNPAGLERYWQKARYPENVDVLAGYAPFEVLDADQDEHVEESCWLNSLRSSERSIGSTVMHMSGGQ
ncbi:hypothetical protein QA640_44535 (plasmid) [Bradyrhizobium sp. CB82]|uniref:hypothetical protein n=1 Tax=Bradyrhizobium sp. CB82 TaxID=3039159 RepID=UPI0024B0D48B|nr:hypothetical protein [Bradyrhizobium sp. CB82]WFU45879.1 hypothetical protein QA640_44535 [Bradyrhizobium sp. CB82]